MKTIHILKTPYYKSQYVYEYRVQTLEGICLEQIENIFLNEENIFFAFRNAPIFYNFDEALKKTKNLLKLNPQTKIILKELDNPFSQGTEQFV